MADRTAAATSGTLDSALHDVRNSLAIAIATTHAFIDEKLAPENENLHDLLTSLEAVDAALPSLRHAARIAQTGVNDRILEAIVEGSPYAKVLVDDRGRIVLVNAQTEKLFGYAREELLGRSIDMLVPPRFAPGHAALRDWFNAAPVARPMGAGRDLYGRRSDGGEVPIEIGLNPIRTESHTFTLAAISDITERKHAEALRLLHAGVAQHAAQLEELNRELASASRFKTQFVATMSHELRTPLNAIIGAAELLETAQLDDRARISVRTITEAAEGLFALINSVLDFSKIESGKVELRNAAFSVETLLEGTADVVAQLAREKGVMLHTYAAPEIPVLRGDPDRLRQIILNLLANAVKFTERGHIIARVTPFDRSSHEVSLRFEVEDTGSGIAPDALPILFEPFSQASSTAGRVSGTGLGLSIARSLVELMGGEIGVRSQPGNGSLFWFTVRFALASGSFDPHKKPLDGIAGLVLSGDETFVEIVERYLTSWSMAVRRVRSRDDVLDALRDRSRVWIAIADAGNAPARDTGVPLDALRAILPCRVITIGDDGPLRKPIRQSHLYDAIVRAGGIAPAPSANGADARPAHLAPLVGHGIVLVAEDNLQLQRLLRLQFADLGVAVEFVSDGRAAVDAVRDHAYAIVFMDCQMPELDGLAATRIIRSEERQRGGHVPIAAMTANAFAEDREACLNAGMDDYLAKPIRLNDLRAMIQRWAPATG